MADSEKYVEILVGKSLSFHLDECVGVLRIDKDYAALLARLSAAGLTIKLDTFCQMDGAGNPSLKLVAFSFSQTGIALAELANTWTAQANDLVQTYFRDGKWAYKTAEEKHLALIKFRDELLKILEG